MFQIRGTIEPIKPLAESSIVECRACGIEQVDVKANAQLEELLSGASDVVPCPNCGALTERMKKEQWRNRRTGVTGIFVGVGLAILGGAICWLLFDAGRGRRTLVGALSGVLIAFAGLTFISTGFVAVVKGSAIKGISEYGKSRN